MVSACTPQVIIGNPDLKANHNITQHVEVVSEYEKMARLRELLKSVMTEQGAKCLIFCETKRGCDEITRNLRQDGWPALALHGDKSQKERDWVLLEFKAGRHPLMLATDVAARGLGRRGWDVLLLRVILHDCVRVSVCM
jgi:ATP-dependent RNA helicase DDX5/DBP2